MASMRDCSRHSVSSAGGSGMRVSPDSVLRLAAVYAYVRILSETMASLPLVIYQRRADGGKDKVTDYWLYRLMAERLNRFQNPFEWREMLQSLVTADSNLIRGQFGVGGNTMRP
jgi:phage portal protein BeeE